MWITGSLVLIITVALVGMTTSPSDYTVAIVDCACAPLEKTSNAILSLSNAALDFFASPLFLLSRMGTGFLDLCKDHSTRIVSSLLKLFLLCVRCFASAVHGLLCYVIDFATKVVAYFDIFDGIVTLFAPLSNMVRKGGTSAQRAFDYVFLDLFIQTYISTFLLYFLGYCHFLLSFPFIVVSSGTEMLLYGLKYIIALPFKCFLGLVKYVLYSLLHPYVCVVYSSCTVGVFVILVPVLMHVCKITDIRPLIRWLCAVAMNTESRNRVLQILHRMASENRREITGEADDYGVGAEPEPEIRDECAVCYQTERLMKIVPCGHRTTCNKCLKEIEKINNRCPICREQIMFIV